MNVKPLDWRKPTKHDRDQGGRDSAMWIAPGFGGEYAIQSDAANFILWRVDDPYAFDTFPTVEAAKAHAEADWQKTIGRKLIATLPGDVLGGEGEAWPTLDQVARVIDPDAWEHVDGCHEAMKGADDTDLKILRSVIDRRLRESGSITTAEQIDALYSAARPSQSDEGEKT